jgi:hypothetical protein
MLLLDVLNTQKCIQLPELSDKIKQQFMLLLKVGTTPAAKITSQAPPPNHTCDLTIRVLQ